MAHVNTPIQAVDAETFDPQSGSLLERTLFNNRGIVVLLCALVTLVLAFQVHGLLGMKLHEAVVANPLGHRETRRSHDRHGHHDDCDDGQVVATATTAATA